MTQHLAFDIAAVFPNDDPLSEWVVTLAIAMNDLALVHGRREDEQDAPERAFYWNRLAISHYTEAALFLFSTRDEERVREFVDSLDDEARAKYAETLDVFAEVRGRLFDVRNKATFHYPELRTRNDEADRPIRDALGMMRNDRGVIRSTIMRNSRALFADDVVTAIFAREVGGFDRIDEFKARVATGTTAFITFARRALATHLERSGAAITEVEPVDPMDPTRGWRNAGEADSR
jgi:hypothetical protein